LSLVPFVLLILLFYFLLIAPARRKQKKHADMLRALKNGDRVVTQGGLYGTVVGVGEQVVQLRIADGVKVEVAKHAVAGLQASAGE
jgi:preprotein translocase subunit YajC